MIRYPKISHARRRMMSCTGRLYAAYSRYCDWVKVGFTLDLSGRLEAIDHQYREFAPFSLIGSSISTWGAEQQLHRALEPFRQRQTGRSRELYPACHSVVGAVKRVVSNPRWDRLEIDELLAFRRWAYQAARAPLNRVEAELAFERFFAERRAA